jgi:hypothetical protein
VKYCFWTNVVTSANAAITDAANCSVPTEIITRVSLVSWALPNIKDAYVTISGIVELPNDGLSIRAASNIVNSPKKEESRMKWLTRARPKVDRVACPWLIKKFVDPEAQFLANKPTMA